MHSSRHLLTTALLLGASLPAHSAAAPFASLPAQLQAALARRSAVAYPPYELSTVMPAFTATVRIDPARSAGQRVSVVTPPPPDRAAQFAEHRAEFDKAAAVLLWCDERVADLLPDTAQLSSETPDTITYQFQPNAAPAASAQDRKMLSFVRAFVTLARQDGAILSVLVRSPQPFSPMLLVHVDSYELSLQCTPTAGHRSQLRSLKQRMQGSAFGRHFDDSFEQRFRPLANDPR